MPGLVVLGSKAAGWMAGRARARTVPVRRHKRISPASTPVFPVGLDVAQLLEAARAQFILLQAAWDRGDMATLRALTTPQMLDDLCAELPCAAASNQTDVVSLQASLLAFDDFGTAWLATVEFTGMIREQPLSNAAPFRELWLLTRERSAEADASAGPAWRLARQQTLL